jgi:hypothetical protein
LRTPAKNPLPAPMNPLLKLSSLPNQHKLKQLRNALRELVDLRARGRIEDGQAGVDVPLVGVDAEHYVYFYGFVCRGRSTRVPRGRRGSWPRLCS